MSLGSKSELGRAPMGKIAEKQRFCTAWKKRTTVRLKPMACGFKTHGSWVSFYHFYLSCVAKRTIVHSKAHEHVLFRALGNLPFLLKMSLESTNLGPVALYLDEESVFRCFKGHSLQVMMSLRQLLDRGI